MEERQVVGRAVKAAPACPECRSLDIAVVREGGHHRAAVLRCNGCGRETDEAVCVFVPSPPGPGEYPWPRSLDSDAEWRRLHNADLDGLVPLELLAEARRLEDALAYTPAVELDRMMGIGEDWVRRRDWVAARLEAIRVGARATPTTAEVRPAPTAAGWDWGPAGSQRGAADA